MAKKIIFFVVAFLLWIVLEVTTGKMILGMISLSVNFGIVKAYLTALHLLALYTLLSPVYKKITKQKDSNVISSTLTATE